jgi:poly(A) polymerase
VESIGDDQPADQVARALKAAGHQAFFVGGCVRDKLLGRPLHDRDLTTDAKPEAVRALFPEAVEVGAHFGVVLIRRGGEELQVATFRSEGAYQDGRHPGQVRFETDARADVLRRDFTINALLEDPFTGEITDYTGGVADLEARWIRAIGEPGARFGEDHLRMLRAVRLAARLGFEIHPDTMKAIQCLAPAILGISVERIRDEVSRILTEGGARRGFELLDESGLLAVILPEVARMKGVEQPPDFHPEGDVWVHTLGVLERLSGPTIELALAALLHDVGKPVTQTIQDRIRFSGHDRAGAAMAREILTRLRYPHEVVENVVSMVAQHMRFRDAPRMAEATFKRFVRQPLFEELLELHRVDLLGGQRPLYNYEIVRARRDGMGPEELRPPALLNGRDLIGMGYEPGPRFAVVLQALEDEQLEGRIRTRDEAERFVRRVWERAST